jgi:hypothetical protein
MTVRDETAGAADRALFWIAAMDRYYTPAALTGWQRVDLDETPEIIAPDATVPGSYSVLFEATCNSMLNYDPVVQAKVLYARFQRPPDVLVALVAESPEVHVDAQHAIAYEVGHALRSPRVDVVTVSLRWSEQSEQKVRKAQGDSPAGDGEGNPSALDEALEIVAGKKRGHEVKKAAARFVYAYLTNKRGDDQWHCDKLQRGILSVMASRKLETHTTAAIAEVLHTTERRVGNSITELIDGLFPDEMGRALGVSRARDSRARLYSLMHNYGVWIRLVDARQKQLGSTL